MYKTSSVPQVGLEPTRLTSQVPKTCVAAITPSGYNHIRQAFYFQHREIVSNLTHLTAVWVPEDMIFCSPSWNRTTNISLEVRSYIHLTNRPIYHKDNKKNLFCKTFFVDCIGIVFFCIVSMN